MSRLEVPPAAPQADPWQGFLSRSVLAFLEPFCRLAAWAFAVFFLKSAALSLMGLASSWLMAVDLLHVAFYGWAAKHIASRRVAEHEVNAVCLMCILPVCLQTVIGHFYSSDPCYTAYFQILLIIIGAVMLDIGGYLWSCLVVVAIWALGVEALSPDRHEIGHWMPLLATGVVGFICLHARQALLLQQFELLKSESEQVARLGEALSESQRSGEELDNTLAERAAELQHRLRDLHESSAERQRLNQSVLHSQKVESLGRLAGGLAHDFNNLLTVLMGNLYVLRGRATSEESNELLSDVEEVCRRAKDLTGHLLTLSGRRHLRLETKPIGQVVEGCRKLLLRAVGSSVEVQIQVECPDVAAQVDSSAIYQALQNLFINADQAMQGSGRLLLRISHQAHGPVGVGEPWPTPVAAIRFDVTDNGPGIDPALLDKVVDPFFTTKERGTGLGLAIVQGIVTKHDGRFSLQSGPDGTTASFWLPVAQPIPAVSPTRAELPAPSRGRGTILVVEDEPPLRQMLEKFLRRTGYTVVGASDGHSALELYQSMQPPPNLVITDVVMPGMDGGQLATMLRAQRPEQEILFVSGYTQDRLDLAGIDPSTCHFLAKPYQLAEIAAVAQELIVPSRPVAPLPPSEASEVLELTAAK